MASRRKARQHPDTLHRPIASGGSGPIPGDARFPGGARRRPCNLKTPMRQNRRGCAGACHAQMFPFVPPDDRDVLSETPVWRHDADRTATEVGCWRS